MFLVIFQCPEKVIISGTKRASHNYLLNGDSHHDPGCKVPPNLWMGGLKNPQSKLGRYYESPRKTDFSKMALG